MFLDAFLSNQVVDAMEEESASIKQVLSQASLICCIASVTCFFQAVLGHFKGYFPSIFIPCKNSNLYVAFLPLFPLPRPFSIFLSQQRGRFLQEVRRRRQWHGPGKRCRPSTTQHDARHFFSSIALTQHIRLKLLK